MRDIKFEEENEHIGLSIWAMGEIEDADDEDEDFGDDEDEDDDDDDDDDDVGEQVVLMGGMVGNKEWGIANRVRLGRSLQTPIHC